MQGVHEYKAAEPFEMSELSTEHRTGVIAHCAFDNLDKKRDIARKGMFDKSWKEYKAIAFLIDHDPRQRPGIVTNVYQDEKKAYTKVKFGNHTLGTDTMLMMDEGIIKGASFGFYTIKANKIMVGGKPARELKEVLQDETTVSYALSPINDLAGVVKVTKAEMGALHEFKAHLDRIESFCRNTTASDDTIIKLEAELKASREIISQYDTADTGVITQQSASRTDNDSFREKLLLLNLQLPHAVGA